MTRRFVVTSAVNQARVSKPFWASLNVAAKHLNAELIVVASKYKNVTKRGKKVKGEDGQDVYAKELLPYLTRKRRVLGKNLTLLADVPVQPTAGNPTSGMEVFAKDTSAIIGHPKRALTVVPTTRHPRALWTTGACTLPSYSKSRAGARGEAHHVLGALIVEVVGKTFFVRNITATKDGSFTDLDATYTPTHVRQAKPALAVVAGDIHVGQDDPAAERALRGLVKTVQPKHLVLHDVLDFRTQSHHRQSPRAKFESRHNTVADELNENAVALEEMAGWGAKEVVVVRSNHDEHMDRWLSEETPEAKDAELFHTLWSHLYATHRTTGVWVNPYETAMRWAGVTERVRFLKRGESFRLAGVEHGLHGDRGANGGRGSLLGFSKLGCKVTVGHAHTPGIRDGAFVVGVTGRLDMDYTTGAPSSWLHAHVVLGADSKRQLVITQGSKYRG